MSNRPDPVEVKHTTVCHDCKYREDTMFTICPQCGSGTVHSTTVSQFSGGQITRGHIASDRRFTGSPQDPPVYEG